MPLTPRILVPLNLNLSITQASYPNYLTLCTCTPFIDRFVDDATTAGLSTLSGLVNGICSSRSRFTAAEEWSASPVAGFASHGFAEALPHLAHALPLEEST